MRRGDGRGERSGEEVFFPELPVFGPEGTAKGAEHVHDAVVIERGGIDGLFAWGRGGGCC